MDAFATVASLFMTHTAANATPVLAPSLPNVPVDQESGGTTQPSCVIAQITSSTTILHAPFSLFDTHQKLCTYFTAPLLAFTGVGADRHHLARFDAPPVCFNSQPDIFMGCTEYSCTCMLKLNLGLV